MMTRITAVPLPYQRPYQDEEERRERTLHQVVVGCDQLGSSTALDDPEQSVEDALGVGANIGLAEAIVRASSAAARDRREGEKNAQERSLLLDEQDALDRDGGVGMDNERRVFKMRGEERKDRKELVLGELLRSVVSTSLATRNGADALGCGRYIGT